ncbi:hypothetical protein IF128_07670 [Empedobacter stercoris]|uniref:hypothetical protein n=1 Tax=Empedobacter stercoris TaxID=1628248 RepID=UPI0016624717|nr:hypothetical protein [Empedobacter stercoris]MCA4809618.1 hypothetical protein [Empedobacter stercoris]QNT13541.1 hypothetical protein HNV03_01970 [Empedobacter stercoris]
MEYVIGIIHYFTDSKNKLSHKAIMIILTVILVIFIDNTLSFTYSYNINNKIEHVEKLNSIIKDTSLSKKEKAILKELRNNVLNHQTLKDIAYDKYTSLDFKSKEVVQKPIVKNEKKSKLKERNYWIHFISSSWLIIISMLVVPFVGYTKNSSFFYYIFIIIIFVEPILYFISWTFAKTFSLIPIILDNPTLNYILNAILHLLVFLTLGFIINKFNKKKTEILSQMNK